MASDRASLSKVVSEQIRGQILDGKLRPGERLVEDKLSAELGVSRVPVREALRELESTGLVAARKHAGVFVRVLDAKEVADLYELRSVLDGHVGRRAASLPRPQRLALVETLKRGMAVMKASARRHDVQAYYTANLAFHWAVVEAAENEPLANTYRGIVQQLHLSRLKNLSRDIGMKVSMIEHEQIVAAIADGDVKRAQALQAAHVTASHERLVERLTQGLTQESA
jgi:DNA-binding GntR family transcriptional regulator